MKIHKDRFRLFPDLFENRIHQKERIVHIRLHKGPAQGIKMRGTGAATKGVMSRGPMA
jgi:hypothetical protein